MAAVENPLVLEYLQKKKEAEEARAQAEQDARNKEMLSGGLQALGGLVGTEKAPVVYQKGWNETGAPEVAKGYERSIDTSPLTKAADRDRTRGKEKEATIKADFFEGEKVNQMGRDDEKRQKEEDPNSDESKLAQELAGKMLPGKDFSTMSASQIKGMLPTLERMYSSEWENKFKQESLKERRAERAHEKGLKDAEKEEQLTTPFGKARTADDAKKLKDASEKKEKFDRIMQEMIDLRNKHNGGAMWNREDVARAKQLAGDAKIIYKDLANLGVLSASDNVLIDQVIPADPLEYNISGLARQDPTKKKLESFKSDVQKDFETTVRNRTREGTAPKTVARKQYSPSRNQTKITYTDGTTEIVDGQQ